MVLTLFGESTRILASCEVTERDETACACGDYAYDYWIHVATLPKQSNVQLAVRTNAQGDF